MINSSIFKFSEVDFSNEGQLEDYVTTKDYDIPSSPGICAAIVIQDTANGYNVKLRYDDNNYGQQGDDSAKPEIPTTRLPSVSLLNR